MLRFAILLPAFLLVSCQSAPKGYWYSGELRVDATPALLERFQRDRAICDGEAAKAALASHERSRALHVQNIELVFDGCLVERGYVRRPG